MAIHIHVGDKKVRDGSKEAERAVGRIKQECQRIIERSEGFLKSIQRGGDDQKLSQYEESWMQTYRALSRM